MTEPDKPPAATPRAARTKRELLSFAELFGLSGLAVAQPTFDLLGRNTGILIRAEVNPLELFALVVTVLFGPPLILWIVEWIIGAIHRAARQVAHQLALGVFAAILVIEIARHQAKFGPSLALAAGVVGGIGLAALARVDWLRIWLRVLAVAPFLFALLFAFSSPATNVVFGHGHGAAGVRATHPVRVVMVVLDEFPEESLLDGSGHIDKELFPNFAQFAGGATWYRNDTTVAPYTDVAVPAILTGQYPKKANAFADAVDYPDNLFTLLGRSYQMNVHEIVTKLCSSRICAGSSGSGISGLLEQTAHLWKDYASPNGRPPSLNVDEGTTQPLRTAQDFTASLTATDAPRVDFVHIELPHQPWHLLATLQDDMATDAPPVGASVFEWSDPYSARVGRQRHLLQVQATDTLFGQMLTKLKSVHGYDNSLVIVTADHGVAFTNGEPLRSVSEKNYPQIMWTPLLVKYPGQQAPVVDDRPAESIDVLPTVAAVLGVNVPWHLDGHSLLGAARAEGQRRIYPRGRFAFEPPHVLKAPPGRSYLEFPGATGFAAVLRSRAAPADSDPDLRIYRDIEYGYLVGQQSAPLIRGESGNEVATVKAAQRFDDPQPDAKEIPWQLSQGFIKGISASQPLAIVRAGRVIGVSHAVLVDNKGDAFFTFIVPPSLVTPAGGRPSVFIVHGPPTALTLEPVRMQA